ncbi:MAG TPA: ABC transporter permease [Aggregatilineales bacterium]|nr:ABC transporter permease [Aggregatilineales bacterium]
MTPFRIFRVVFTKESREMLRDRKTLLWLFAPPFILPAIAILAAAFIGTQTARYITQGFPLEIANAQAAPDLVKALKASKALIVTELPASGIKSSLTDPAGDPPGAPVTPNNELITLTIPDDFQQVIDSGQQAHLTLTQRDNTFVTTLALGAARSEIAAYNDSVFQKRLAASGHDANWLRPVSVDETQAAAVSSSVTAAATGSSGPGLGSIFLPLALTSWLIGGGLGLIVDTTVGEKERQTIESILVTPASRLGIVLGKLTVVFLTSLAVMGLWMVEGLALTLLGDAAPKIMAVNSPSLGDVMNIVGQSGHSVLALIAILILLLVPFIMLLNCVVMIFCSFAGSYRESNVFLFLLQLILPALVLLSVFSVGPDAGVGWYAAPILGTIIAIRDLFSQTLTASGLAFAVVSATIYALAALGLATYIYSREWALTRGI